ncbi:hypothetical protein H8S90_20205 [Olivibacter sp. SDN3]|uniref:hypothetical protein n=1 Tax=Olivibacter sp. SDN3 TaxID=2764720 RepID=UPI001650EE66|nr:hypothetical protein [Olivibacter sp. SDN3]QNL49048.1 hypothetical protein H8S90_20205 [Olivibacter sp. SDN3]
MAFTICLGLIILCYYQCGNHANQPLNDENRSMMGDSIPPPSNKLVLLDSTVKVFFIDSLSMAEDTIIQQYHHIRFSGDAFFDIDEKKDFPLYIFTSLMEIKVLSPSSFRVAAYDADQGQSVEMIEGDMIISKAYASPFPEPDTLTNNNLYMVNKSIDLSEKEQLDNPQLIVWWEQFKHF